MESSASSSSSSSVNLASRTRLTPKTTRINQLSHLSLLLTAINNACKTRANVRYSSAVPSGRGGPLTDFQTFLCKLAQVCDTKKGGDTITSLVCLCDSGYPEYLLTSNSRKSDELDKTKEFLFGLLDYVRTNPENLNPKPIQKQVLWRILDYNFEKLAYYLRTLGTAVKNCLNVCDARDQSNSEVIKQLHNLEEKLNFPYDMTSTDNARPIFLRNCERVINAIQTTKGLKASVFDAVVDRYASSDVEATSMHWCELRHYLGRLHSYRQASEVIAKAPTDWPAAFQNFRVSYIPSASMKRISLATEMKQVLQIAFPGEDLKRFYGDIKELEKFGLHNEIHKQLRNGKLKTYVHTEIHLHDHLVQKGKTTAEDFFQREVFIATSKPPCRLCHVYFNLPENSFQVQPPHMNLYPKWRLPDIYEQNCSDIEAEAESEDLMDDMIAELQEATLETLEEKLTIYKRFDSDTGSYRGTDTRFSNRTESTDARYMPSRMSMRSQASPSGRESRASTNLQADMFDVAEDWNDLAEDGSFANHVAGQGAPLHA